MMVQDLVYRISATNAGLKTAVRDSQQSIRSLMDTAERGVRSLENMSRKMSRTGTILFTGISALTKTTINSAASFEKSMRRVQAVSQSTATEYRKLSAAALEMSTTTEHSAMAVAEGMNFMAMAGFDANEIMEAMPSVLQLASAGVMDLGTAADITTNILTGYGMEISELANANDILVSAMTGANVDLVDLGQSFKYVGPIAKAAGIEFSETAAMVALMGNAGIQGSMAGTSLRQAITNLLNPTKQARDIMDRLGIKINDANGNLLSMTEILHQLEDKGASASDMMILFGQRAGPAMSALLEQGVDELEKFQQRLEDSEGLAARIESMMVDTAEGQKQIFKNTANAIRIMFGQDMIPYYRTAVFFLQGIADRIKQMEPEQRMQIIRIAAITGAIVGLVAVLGFLGMAIAGIVKGFLSFGSAIMFLMSMKGLAIGAIIIAVGLLKKAWDSDFGGIKTKTEDVWETVEPILTAFWEFLQRSWEWVIEWGGEAYKWLTETTWMEKKEDMQGWFEDGWTWVLNHVGEAWEWLTEGGLSNSLDTLKAKITNTEAWKWTITTVGKAFKYIMESDFGVKLEELRTKLTDSTLWQWTIDTALPAILEGGEIVLKAIIEAGGKLYDAIKKGLDTGDWSDFWDVAEDIWSTGVLIGIALSSTVKGISAVLNAIKTGLGLAATTLGAQGILGLLTVGIQLKEAEAKGSYEAFAKNVLAAGLMAAFLYPITGRGGALAGFTLVLNLKLGEEAYDGFIVLFEWIGHNLKMLFTGRWGEFMSFDEFIREKASARLAEEFYAENLQNAIKWLQDEIPEERWDERTEMAADIWNVDENEIRRALGLPEVDRVLESVMQLAEELAGMYPQYGWQHIEDVALEKAYQILDSPTAFYEIMNAVDSFVSESERIENAIDELSREMGADLRSIPIEELSELIAEYRSIVQDISEQHGVSVVRLVKQLRSELSINDETVDKTEEFKDLLDAIYRAEGGAEARVPYGMTSFADAGNKFSKPDNQALFEELSQGMVEGSDEYYRTAALVSAQHYWNTFQQKFPGIAGQTFDQLDPEMQQLFVLHMGRWFSPPSAHELNKNWVPNVLDALGHGDAAAEFRAGSQELLDAWIEGAYDMASDAEAAAAYIAGIFADYLVGESPPPKGPLSNIKLGMKNTMDAGIEGAEEGLLGGIRRLLLAAQKIGEAARAWGRDLVRYFTEGVEEEATNQQVRMEEIASRLLMPITFDNPENDLWIFGSGVDLMRWFGKGISSAAQGVVEIVRMLMDKMFDAIRKVIQERYPELLEFFNSLKEEVDEGIKAVEEFVSKLGIDGEGEKAIKELDAVTTSWLQSLSNGLASAIVHGESLYDVFDNLLRMIAQQALSGLFMRGMTTILSTAGYSVPIMHFGGLVMHSGGMIDGLRPDEVPIIAQKGERILSRKQNDQFEQMLEDLNGMGMQNINLNIYANDAKSFVDMIRRNPEGVISVLVDDYQGNGIIRRLVRGG